MSPNGELHIPILKYGVCPKKRAHYFQKSVITLDAQSVKHSDIAQHKSDDARKKVSG